MENIDNDELLNMYIDALQEAPTPFDNYVSRSNIPDIIDIENSHKIVEREVFRALKRTIRDKVCRDLQDLGRQID